MIPVKWKIYRIMNYVLLIGSTFVFVKIFEEGMRSSYEPIAILIALVILFLMIQSIINLAIMTKCFPGKLLTGAKSGWHTFSTIINGISFTGIGYAFVNMLSEIDDYTYSQYKKAIMITILIFILLLAIVLFIFICQLTLKRYLRRTNTDLINSMINSIGSDELKQE